MARVRTVLICIAAIVITSAGPVTAGFTASGLPDQIDWSNGEAVSWTLDYTATTRLVTFTIDNAVLQYTMPMYGSTDLVVTAKTVNGGSEILMNSLVLDGEKERELSNAAERGFEILRISSAELSAGIVLMGRTTMSWSGEYPARSLVEFQIKADNLETVYVEKATWGQLKDMYND